jgi:Lsr2
MASETFVTITCDIPGNGGPNGEATSHTLYLNGHLYDIDLCTPHLLALTRTLEGYAGHARRVPAPVRAHRRPRTAAHRRRAQEIRRWARAHADGRPVPDEGRLPGWALREYEAAH